MTSHLSAEMILSTGPAAAPVEKAIGTVQEVLCRPQSSSKDVYAIVFRTKQETAKHPDHLSIMNAVITAARKSWDEVRKSPSKRRPHEASPKHAIEVTELNGIWIYRGCASPEEFEKSFVLKSGIYIFPSHLHVDTVAYLGLAPLSKEVRALPIVLRVGIEDDPDPVRETSAEELDRESLEWRQHFVSNYKVLTASEVADQAGNTAKNRSAIASRWTDEKKIFWIRFQNKTLYPGFQFKDGEPIPAIAEILKDMPPAFTGWDLAFFFTTPNAYLDGKLPLDLLKLNPKKVIPIAHAFTHPADGF